MKKTMIECGKMMLMCMAAMLLPWQCANAEDAWQGLVNGSKWVDVGTSVLWATCDVGAENEYEVGVSFAWGETATKSTFTENNYVYAKSGKYTKYVTETAYGYNKFVDNKMTLEPGDDAVFINMGAPWRMPTDEEFKELNDSCVREFTSNYANSGVSVGIFYKAKFDSDKGLMKGKETLTGDYSLSDIHIFFPTQEIHKIDYGYTMAVGMPVTQYHTDYWTLKLKSTLFPYYGKIRVEIGLYTDILYKSKFPYVSSGDYRYKGRPVRGVISKEDWDEMLTDVRDAEKSENTVWRSGEWLFVSCNEAVQRIEVLTLDGKMLLSQEISGNKVQLLVSERNVLVRLIDKNGKVSVHKVM